MGIFRKKKIVLALGGGAARGFCNLGVLKVLEKKFGRGKLPFDMIVGTSMGSLVGAAYSSGFTLEELKRRALAFTWPTLVDLGIHPTGLMKGDKLEKAIVDMLADKTFRDLAIPFALTATDLQSGEELIYTSGDLVKLVRASCSWPGFFNAVEYDGRKLVDGGIRNSVPTKAAYKLGATFVVAVNPGFSISPQKIDNALKALVQSVQIMGEELNMYQASMADIAIRPELKNVDQFGFDKAEYIIAQGEAAALEAIDELERKIRFHRFSF